MTSVSRHGRLTPKEAAKVLFGFWLLWTACAGTAVATWHYTHANVAAAEGCDGCQCENCTCTANGGTCECPKKPVAFRPVSRFGTVALMLPPSLGSVWNTDVADEATEPVEEPVAEEPVVEEPKDEVKEPGIDPGSAKEEVIEAPILEEGMKAFNARNQWEDTQELDAKLDAKLAALETRLIEAATKAAVKAAEKVVTDKGLDKAVAAPADPLKSLWDDFDPMDAAIDKLTERVAKLEKSQLTEADVIEIVQRNFAVARIRRTVGGKTVQEAVASDVVTEEVKVPGFAGTFTIPKGGKLDSITVLENGQWVEKKVNVASATTYNTSVGQVRQAVADNYSVYVANSPAQANSYQVTMYERAPLQNYTQSLRSQPARTRQGLFNRIVAPPTMRRGSTCRQNADGSWSCN